MFIVFCFVTCHAWSGEIGIRVRGVEQVEGFLRFVIFEQAHAEDFPIGDNAVRRLRVATENVLQRGVLIKNLPAGRYAVAVYHDIDSDGVFDTNVLGIPTEDYGFSRNASPGFFSPPSFADAAFDLSEQGRKMIVIDMQK